MNIFKWLWPANTKRSYSKADFHNRDVTLSELIDRELDEMKAKENAKKVSDINRTFDHLRDIQPIEIDQMENRSSEFHNHPDPVVSSIERYNDSKRSYTSYASWYKEPYETALAIVARNRITSLEKKLLILHDYHSTDSHLDPIEQEIWDKTVSECEALTKDLEL